MKSITAIVAINKSTKKLEQLLLNHPEVNIVNKTENFKNLLELIDQQIPDIVFIDVDYMNCSDYRFLTDSISHNLHFPELILMSGINFENNSINQNENIYLLKKPVTQVQINQVIKQIHINRTQKELVLHNHTSFYTQTNQDKLMIPVVTGLKVMELKEIFYIKKQTNDANHISVFFDSEDRETLTGCLTLKQMMNALPENRFYQIDRNTIINFNYLQEIETKSRICILSKNKKAIKLTISKNRLKEIKELSHSMYNVQ